MSPLYWHGLLNILSIEMDMVHFTYEFGGCALNTYLEQLWLSERHQFEILSHLLNKKL